MSDDAEPEDDHVSIEISLAENVYVSIKTNLKGYDDVLKDAREVVAELNTYMEKRHKMSENNSDKLYG
jgi:hypothetical protein